MEPDPSQPGRRPVLCRSSASTFSGARVLATSRKSCLYAIASPAPTFSKKAQAAAKRKRTIAHLPESTRRGLQQQARRGRERGGEAGHALQDRNREQIYEIAKEKDIKGRSKMGKWELIEAIRKAV
jgi:hypothetical protein